MCEIGINTQIRILSITGKGGLHLIVGAQKRLSHLKLWNWKNHNWMLSISSGRVYTGMCEPDRLKLTIKAWMRDCLVMSPHLNTSGRRKPHISVDLILALSVIRNSDMQIKFWQFQSKPLDNLKLCVEGKPNFYPDAAELQLDTTQRNLTVTFTLYLCSERTTHRIYIDVHDDEKTQVSVLCITTCKRSKEGIDDKILNAKSKVPTSWRIISKW